jgi:CRP/FNR family transcriptional regulator, cyclic AMP receptor protein
LRGTDSVVADKSKPKFDPEAFLAKVEGGVSIAKYGKGQVIFAQGDAVDSVFYIREGRVKISVVSAQGKEAVVAFLKAGDFIGEGCCLTGRARRVATARALEDSVITRVDKSTMVRMLHDEADFSELFTAHLLARTVRVEEDLVDQLFNSSEKRLARALLYIGEFRQGGKAGDGHRQSQPRDACGHDRHDALPREPLYEQVSPVGLHRLQRKPRGPYLIVGCCSARKAANKNA